MDEFTVIYVCGDVYSMKFYTVATSHRNKEITLTQVDTVLMWDGETELKVDLPHK